MGVVALVAFLGASQAEAQRQTTKTPQKAAPHRKKARPKKTKPPAGAPTPRLPEAGAVPPTSPPPGSTPTPPPRTDSRAVPPTAGAVTAPPVGSTPTPSRSSTGAPPPSVATPTPAEAADVPPGDLDTRRRPNALPLVVLGVEPMWEGRFFRHTEFTAPNVRSYDANGYASLALAAEVFPLSNVGPKFWRGFGVTLRYARAFGFRSESTRLGDLSDVRASPVDTSFSRYAAGLRYRIALNPASQSPFVLGTSLSI